MRRMMEISFYRGQRPFVPPVHIDSIALSNLTFVSGVDAVVGLISVYMATPPFSGSLTVGGADAASFKIVGSNLVTNGTIAAGTYSITLIATQATANNSPFTSDPFTITGSASQSFVSLGLSNTSFTPDGISAVTVGNVLAVLNPASPASTATITLGGTNAASFQLTNGGVLPCAVQAKSTTGVGRYTIALTATQVGIGGSPFPSGNIGVSGSTAVATSITFANKAASSSPATTPLTVTQVFKRGAVPSGFIAVPTVSGSALTYQADARSYWDDGSLRVAVFRCLTSSFAGSSSKQITFPISAGSYSNTSSKTTADITGASDFKLEFTNVHTACIPDPVGVLGQIGAVALTIGGGHITGGTVLNNPTLSGTINVVGGGGTGGQVSISGSALSVVSGGSGYANVGGGTFTSSFNSIVASGAAKDIVQFAKGPVCDAWRVRQALSGMAHFHVTFYVERWKDAVGSFLAFKAYAIYGSGLLDEATTIPNYTFGIDWKNGSTVIRGKSNSDVGFINNLCYIWSSAATFKRGASGVSYVDSARPDWCDNANAVWSGDTVVSQIIQQRTPTECSEIKATGMIAPWLAISPTFTTPSTGTATSYNFGTGIQDTILAIYQPFGSAGLRCTFGSGGSDETEAPIPGAPQGAHWMWLKQGDTTKANIYLVSSRTACAHGLGTIQCGAGWFDTTNLRTPCVIPSSAHTFSGLTQDSSLYYVNQAIGASFSAYQHSYFAGGGTSNNPYHQPCYAYYAYLHDGEQWMLDAQYHSGSVFEYWVHPGYFRQATLGATTYYGIYGNGYVGGNIREAAWLTRSQGFATALMPTTWADGTTQIETSYSDYLTAANPNYLNALITFTGTYSDPGNAPISKTVDYTNSGIYPDIFDAPTYAGIGGEINVPFMMDYQMANYSHIGYILRGTATGNAINSFLEYSKNYYVKYYAYTGSHYLQDTYRLNYGASPGDNAAPSDLNYDSMGNVANPKLGYFVHNNANSVGGTAVAFKFTNGSSTVNVHLWYDDTSPASMAFQGTNPATCTRVANGSRIKLTTTNIEQGVSGWRTLPAPYNTSTWYYWKELSASSGQLCTDAGLTSPVTCSGSTTSGIFPWVCPSNMLPADNSGVGTVFSGATTGGSIYNAWKYGVMRQLKAYEIALNGSASPDTTLAVAHLKTMFDTINTPNGDAAFADYVALAFDDSLT